MIARRYRLKHAGLTIPMPDRGGRLFTARPRGEAVDPQSPFYARLIAEGSIVPAGPVTTGAARPRPTAKGKRS